MKNVLVNYEVVSGEWSAHSVRTFRLEGEDVTEVIHSFFKDFWAEDTVVNEKGRFYHHESWEQAVKISRVREISDFEIEVFEKYSI